MTIVFCHYLQNFPTEGQRVFSLLILAIFQFLNQAYFLITALTALKVMAKGCIKPDPNGYNIPLSRILQNWYRLFKVNVLRSIVQGVFSQEYTNTNVA